jgi:3-deoxy-manno-octulosonate cytidylyltransferase (CMP-KDO synthetase)
MIECVYRQTRTSDAVDGTYVAMPDKEVREATESLGGEAITTGQHPRATDHVAEENGVKTTNLATSIPNEAEYGDPNKVKVIVDDDWHALYFAHADES